MSSTNAKINIFISFSGKDKTLVTPLKNYIQDCCEKSNMKCKIYFSPYSNIPGDDWENKIIDEIDKSNIVIVFWSKNSNSSMGQLIEIGAAWALKKEICAILYETSYIDLPKMVLTMKQSIQYRNLSENQTRINFTQWLLTNSNIG
jgi:TIR domain